VVIEHYEININPQLRTTQEYAIVNYSPAATSVTLTDPMSLNCPHSRRIKRTTFPDGEYKIDDYGRASKTLNLSGIELTDAFTKINTVKTMLHYDAEVTISGLADPNLNKNYRLKDFTPRQEPGDVSIYRWDMVLEEV
jgi:hypothetical protein